MIEVLGMMMRVAGQQETFLGKFPWLGDFLWGILAVGMVCLLVYWLRPGGDGIGGVDFVIKVHGEEVQFSGKFPAGMEGMVEDFLVNDVRVEGKYEVVGKWEEGRLAVNVRGENATWAEQRIRNFLKLNVKRS